MALFETIYNRVIEYSKRDSAPMILGGLSFFESFILPFPPPDVLLAPMSLAQPAKAMRFATITLVTSLLGGLVGYLIGAFLFESIEPLIIKWGYGAAMNTVMEWFDVWGFWAVLVAGFSPVPYKLFTVSAGAMSLALLPFMIASLIGRGVRFYLVAFLLAYFGPSIESKLMRYVERIGWSVVVILLIVIIVSYAR